MSLNISLSMLCEPGQHASNVILAISTPPWGPRQTLSIKHEGRPESPERKGDGKPLFGTRSEKPTGIKRNDGLIELVCS